MKTKLLAWLGLSFCLLAHAAEPTNPIDQFRHTVVMDAALLETDVMFDKSQADHAVRGMKDLDTLLKPAIAAADGHDDLKIAIKQFYVAAKTYFDSSMAFTPLPDYVHGELRPSAAAVEHKKEQARLKTDLDAKANALELEMKLAGVPILGAANE